MRITNLWKTGVAQAVSPAVLLGFGLAAAAIAQDAKQVTPSPLLQVRRIYVEHLTGGPPADALRDLIIASIDQTKLFVLTDNPDHADAVLKGAGDDQAFTDTFDSQEGASSRQNGGKSSSGYRTGGLYGGISSADNESYHIKERKHEAYASVRLCTRDGDVLWSTTQESLGAKFRGASADVAAKIARQLSLDVERARRNVATPAQAGSGAQ